MEFQLELLKEKTMSPYKSCLSTHPYVMNRFVRYLLCI